jgi:hypothetical protein
MVEIPKTPKLPDLVEVVVALDARVSELEGIAASNRARLDSLDAGVDSRRREVEGIRARLDRERFVGKLGRRR